MISLAEYFMLLSPVLLVSGLLAFYANSIINKSGVESIKKYRRPVLFLPIAVFVLANAFLVLAHFYVRIPALWTFGFLCLALLIQLSLPVAAWFHPGCRPWMRVSVPVKVVSFLWQTTKVILDFAAVAIYKFMRLSAKSSQMERERIARNRSNPGFDNNDPMNIPVNETMSERIDRDWYSR